MMNGFGRGYGFRFHGSSPPWPYVGIGRGGFPRRAYGAGFAGVFPAYPYYTGEPPAAWGMNNVPQATAEQEIEYLEGQAKALKSDLEHIQSRIEELEKEQKE